MTLYQFKFGKSTNSQDEIFISSDMMYNRTIGNVIFSPLEFSSDEDDIQF